jgi:membrane protein
MSMEDVSTDPLPPAPGPPGARTHGPLLREAVALWSSKDPFQLAGALAFYTLFSAAPLLIIAVTITGAVFGEEAARGEVAGQVAGLLGAETAEILETAIRRSRTSEGGLLPTVLGVGALLFGATTVFAQLQAALNRIWGVKPLPSRKGIWVFVLSRVVSFGMVLILGFLLLVSFLASMALQALLRHGENVLPLPPGTAWALDLALSLGIASLLFSLIFHVLPDARVAWRETWQGGLLTGVLFVAGQYLISLYLTRAGPASLYGAAGALVVLLLWVYYSSLILFFGAAFTRTLSRHRGEGVVPSPGAVLASDGHR